MASIGPNRFQKSLRAAATLSAYRVISPDTALSEGFVRGLQFPTLTSKLLGIAQASATTDQAFPVASFGYGKAAAGASVSAGAILIPVTATGYVIEGTDDYATTTTAVPRHVGLALQSGSLTDAAIEVFITIHQVRKQASA